MAGISARRTASVTATTGPDLHNLAVISRDNVGEVL
jgi:hypothetical protein